MNLTFALFTIHQLLGWVGLIDPQHHIVDWIVACQEAVVVTYQQRKPIGYSYESP